MNVSNANLAVLVIFELIVVLALFIMIFRAVNKVKK